MSSEDRLFAVPDAEPVDHEKLSAGRRLTIANESKLKNGVHPATHRRLLDSAPPRTCSECAHCIQVGGMHIAGRYWKCTRHRLGVSSSGNSDIRKGWPACEQCSPPPTEPCTEFRTLPGASPTYCDRCGISKYQHTTKEA